MLLKVFVELFNTPVEIDATIYLEYFDFNNSKNKNGSNSGNDIKIILRSEKGGSIYLTENFTTNFSTNGGVYLEISGFENEGDYEGLIKFKFIHADKCDVNINFVGSIKSYSVPANKTIRFMNNKIQCEGFDGGTEYSSHFICEFSFPIDENFDESLIPMSKTEIDTKEKLWQMKLDNQEKENEKIFIVGAVIIIILLLIMIVAFLFTQMKSYGK